jgi:hypothetical protein
LKCGNASGTFKETVVTCSTELGAAKWRLPAAADTRAGEDAPENLATIIA